MIKLKKTKSKKTKRDKAGYPRRENHNIPDEYDELLRKEELSKLGKKLDENGRPKPITESQLVHLCVKAVREKWMSCDNKLHFLLSKQVWDTNPNTRTLKLWECNICKGMFKSDEINVDHIQEAGSATNFKGFEVWANNILNAGGDEDLQILCIPCHEVKNVMALHNCTWDEAILKKTLIKKMNQPAKKQIEELLSCGYTKKDLTNSDKREIIYRRLIDDGRLK